MKNTETIAAIITALADDQPATPLEAPGISADLIHRNLLIRTVTMTITGHVERIDSELIELSSAAWIASTGRFADALATGVLDEVEPFADTTWVQRSSVVDMTVWNHVLPTVQR